MIRKLSRPLVILTAFILAFVGLNAQKLSPKEQKWLSRNLKLPSNGINFYLQVSETALSFDQKQERKISTKPETLEAARKRMSEKPFDVDGYVAAARLTAYQGEKDRALAILQTGLDTLLFALQENPSEREYVDGIVELFNVTEDYKGILGILQAINNNQPGVAYFHALFSQYLMLNGYFEPAAEELDIAVGLNPAEPLIYVCEFGLILNHTLSAMQEMDEMVFKYDFNRLEQLAQNPAGSQMALMCMRALECFKVFSETISDDDVEFGADKKNEFKLSPGNRILADNARKWLISLEAKNDPNQYMVHLCLMVLDLMDNNTKEITRRFEIIKNDPLANFELYKLYAINWMRVADFDRAAEEAEKGLYLQDNADSRLLVARLYHEASKEEKAFSLLEPYAQSDDPLMMVARSVLQMSMGKYEEALKLPHPLEDAPDNSDWNYFQGIKHLVEGDRSAAYKFLTKAEENGVYYAQVGKVISYFKLK